MSAGRPGRKLLRTGLQARFRQRLDGGGEFVHLDDEVAEPGADLDPPSAGRWTSSSVTTSSPGNLSMVRLAPSPISTRPSSWYPSPE